MYKRIDDAKKTAKYAFGSLAELGRYIDDTPRTWNSQSSRLEPKADDWDLRAGYAQCVEYAKHGWIEGADKAQEALKVFAPATPRPDVRNDFYGHMPNVPRFCAGAPDSMLRHVNNPTAGMGRVLTLIIPVNASAGTRAGYMANFGLAVAQYVNQLEANNIRVELVGAICSQVSRWRVAHTWQIKAADQAPDMAVIAFALGHPGMFRRLGFALRERCAAPQDWEYGRSESLKLDDVINPPPGAIILNGMLNAATTSPTPKAALAYVTKQIDKAMADNEASA